MIHIPGELVDAPQLAVEDDPSYVGACDVDGEPYEQNLNFPNNAGDGGGSDMSLTNICDDISLAWLLGIKVVVVAGCRPQVEERMARRKEYLEDEDGVNRIENGVRITDATTLRVVKEEAGYVRFEVERQLARSMKANSRRGVQPFIFNDPGKQAQAPVRMGNVVSGNFYSSQPIGVREGCDYQFSGMPRKVEREAIERSLNAGDIVILTSLGVSPSGEMFNVPSEGLSSSVAGALGAEKIVYYLSEGACLRKESSRVVPALRLTEARELLKHKDVKVDSWHIGVPSFGGNKVEGEFLTKLGWGLTALQSGVKRAHLISPVDGALLQELYTRDGSGTMISRDLYDGIRKAQVEDINGIIDLITPLVKEGNLVERPRDNIEKEIHSYYVYTRDDLIIATGQLRRFDDEFAEIGCLVVHPDYQRGGKGDAMLGYLERLCLQDGAKKVRATMCQRATRNDTMTLSHPP